MNRAKSVPSPAKRSSLDFSGLLSPFLEKGPRNMPRNRSRTYMRIIRKNPFIKLKWGYRVPYMRAYVMHIWGENCAHIRPSRLKRAKCDVRARVDRERPAMEVPHA